MEQIVQAIKVFLLFIINNSANICLFSGVILVLGYINSTYGLDTMLLATGVFLIFTSLTIELNKPKYKR